MTRINLEHLIRAIGDMIKVDEITIFGSQSILAQHPDLDNIVKSKNITMSPKKHDIEMLQRSMEADVYVKNPDLANDIEFHMGEQSIFHTTHGYYIDTVDTTTSKLPKDWEKRLIKISNENTNHVSGWCLEKHDLILSKLKAGREKDLEFFYSMMSLSLLQKKSLLKRLHTMEITEADKSRISNLIKKAFSK